MIPSSETPPMSQTAKENLITQVADKASDVVRNEFDLIQTDVQDIKTETERKENEDQVKLARDIPQSVKDKPDVKQKLTNITEKVRQTLIAISLEGNKVNYIKNPPAGNNLSILQTLYNSIDLNDINEKNSIYLNEIIKRGLNNQLTSPQELIDTFKSINYLQYIDPNIYRKISETFQTNALNLGVEKEKLEELKTDEQKGQEKNKVNIETPEQTHKRNELIEETKKELAQFILRQITPEKIEHSNLYDQIENQLKRIPDPKEREMVKTSRLLAEVQRIQNEFRDALLKIYNNDNDTRFTGENDISSGSEEFKKVLDRNIRDGLLVLTDAQYENIIQNVDQLQKSYTEVARIRNSEKGHSMAYMIQQNEVWNTEEKQLLLSLDDSSLLEKLINQKYDSLSQGGWVKFQKDIEGVFNRLFDIAQARPDDFWQESFSELYEGHAFKLIVNRLNNLSDQLKKTEYGRKIVEMEDFRSYSDTLQIESKKDVISKRLTGIRKTYPTFGSALSTLAGRMIDYKKIFEYTHNISQISNLGLGFDKIAEYSSRIKMQDIDRLFYKNPDLVEAYGLYLQNMYQELSLNYHILGTDFGSQDQNKLDEIERRTYKQLAAKKGIEVTDDKRIIRMIKMASGLTKGVTGEFWGAILTARLPMIHKLVEKDGKIKHEITNSFVSLHNSGIEKMMWQVDLDLLLQRFNLPRFWPQMRYAFAPRDLDNSKIRNEYHDFDHTLIYRYKEMADQACFDGRPDELADADEKYTFMYEHFRTASVDYLLRGTWRFQQLRSYFAFTDKMDTKTKRPVVDFNTTIKKMEGIGPYLVKTFIDELFDPKAPKADWSENPLGNKSPISFEMLDLLVEKYKDDYSDFYKNYKKMNNKELEKNFLKMGEIKEIFYREYIFEPLVKMRPTQFIVMESPRYMPEGEKRLSDRLEQYLFRSIYTKIENREHIKDIVLPLYIGAVELVENELWREHKKEWKQRLEEGNWKGSDPLNYKMKAEDFDRPEIKEKLIAYFHLTQDQIGRIVEPGKTYTLRDDEFLTHIKKFYHYLTKQIDDSDRWDRVDKEKRKQEKLPKRYAHMMSKGMGYIDHYLKGNLFDFGEFFLQQAGSRGPERMLGETAGIATKSTPALRQIIVEAIPELVKREYKDQQELEQAVQQILAKPFKEWYDGIAAIDPDQANKDASYLMIYLSALVGKDSKFRMKLVGAAGEDFLRRMWGVQASFMSDHFKSIITRRTTAFDSDQIYTLVHTLSELINLPVDEHKIKGYEMKMGIKRPTYEKNKNSLEQIEKVLNVTMDRRLIEASPMLGPIIFLIMFLMAKLALEKDKKRG